MYRLLRVSVKPSESAWLTLRSDNGDKIFVKTASLGGGEIIISEMDGIETYIDGKFYYLLVRAATEKVSEVHTMLSCPFTTVDGGNGESLITARSREPLNSKLVAELRHKEGVVYARCINPVYDIIPVDNPQMPFTTAKEMFDYVKEKNIPVWQAA